MKRFKTTEKQNHWLDYAKDKYGSQLVQDTKQLFKLLIIFITTPVYWALYGQQVSCSYKLVL